MTTNRFRKDPADVLDYSVNWTAWLGTDTITASTWDVPTGITKVSDTHTTTAATIWVSGGDVGATYLLTNQVVTQGGRTAERSITLAVEDR